ncbi:lipase family protein [Paenibacillus turpanensis]|uniref:lipase family protein n=1 Tax=Paenibacillus turpanensis TaxID=2689078 RepID=UPI00140E757D|nr:hypothetical protein [Paenibacillus turpanensis]
MSNSLPDEVYYELSKEAYDSKYNDQSGPGRPVVTSDGSSWLPIVPDDAKLHDGLSGFDAVVMKNLETNQIVVAFRGTEGDIAEGKLRSVADFITDGKDVFLPDVAERSGFNGFMDKVDDLVPDIPDNPVSDFLSDAYDDTVGEFMRDHNQFDLAAELVEQLIKEYPDYEISLTGHSLGGADAQFAAAKNDVEAVTFSAPSALYRLPEDLQEKAKDGRFDSLITNYVHPSDSIASGAFYEYDRHVGRTYYTDTGFEEANEKYGDGLYGDVQRFIDTVKGDGYHYFQVYKFDKDGHISNPLVNAETGKPVTGGSPRHITEEEAQMAAQALMGIGSMLRNVAASASTALSGLVGGSSAGGVVGVGGGKTIEVNPEQLKEVGQRLRQHADSFHHEMRGVVQSVTNLLGTSQSRRLQPIVDKICTDLASIDRWYTDSTTQIAEYIHTKGSQFQQADQAGASVKG